MCCQNVLFKARIYNPDVEIRVATGKREWWPAKRTRMTSRHTLWEAAQYVFFPTMCILAWDVVNHVSHTPP